MIDLSKFRPLLSATVEPGTEHLLKFPLLGSPKIDGIRVICHPTLGPVTRTLKPVPNKFIREYLSHPMLRWLDGEVVVGDACAPNVFNLSQSGVMSQDGTPDFTYIVFDHFGSSSLNCPFSLRLKDAEIAVREFAVQSETQSRVQFLKHTLIEDIVSLDQFESEMLDKGYEGVMLRHPHGKYKYNRSTFKEHILLKMKRFEDDEAVVIGWEPLYRNNNKAFIDERGYQKRSSHQANKIADDSLLGKLLVRGSSGKWAGVQFDIGSGFTESQRRDYRNQIDSLIGKTVTYKYLPYGSKDAPRHPIFKGFRYD